jgi:hypothetical protein
VGVQFASRKWKRMKKLAGGSLLLCVTLLGNGSGNNPLNNAQGAAKAGDSHGQLLAHGPIPPPDDSLALAFHGPIPPPDDSLALAFHGPIPPPDDSLALAFHGPIPPPDDSIALLS